MVDGATVAAPVTQAAQVPTSHHRLEKFMSNEKGPNVKKKQKCKNCEGKGLVKKGSKVVKCQRCGGTGVR
jgi:DnaJ-class molecular chaperone